MMKRRFLIVVETVTTVVSAIYALIVGFGWASPANLLVFTFLTGAAGAMTVPAWQAVGALSRRAKDRVAVAV